MGGLARAVWMALLLAFKQQHIFSPALSRCMYSFSCFTHSKPGFYFYFSPLPLCVIFFARLESQKHFFFFIIIIIVKSALEIWRSNNALNNVEWLFGEMHCQLFMIIDLFTRNNFEWGKRFHCCCASLIVFRHGELD